MTTPDPWNDPGDDEWRAAVIAGETKLGYESWCYQREMKARSKLQTVEVRLEGHYGTFTVTRVTYVHVEDPTDLDVIGDLAFEKTGIYEDLRSVGWIVQDQGDATWDITVTDGPAAGQSVTIG